MFIITFVPLSNTNAESGKEWTPDSLVNPDELGEFFEGDIMLPLPPRGKNGLLDEQYRWTNGVVNYDFSSDFGKDVTFYILQGSTRMPLVRTEFVKP